MPAPSPGSGSNLQGVATTAARNAWAVGFTSTKNHSNFKTPIVRWNGTHWK